MNDAIREIPPGGARWVGVIVAWILPTVLTWVYFIEAADYTTGAQQAIGVVTKSLQFLFPLVWVGLVLRERPGWKRPIWSGVASGTLFGIAVVAIGWLVFHFLLRESAIFRAATEQIRAKVAGLGLESTTKYVALALFYSLIHSLLEEYYWRWFVFGQLRRLIPRWAAIIVSAIGFAAHHVLVLSLFFGWWTLPTLLFSAAVAIGGVFWAWLYDRSGSLYGPWMSHLIIDAGIFWIGYELILAK